MGCTCSEKQLTNGVEMHPASPRGYSTAVAGANFHRPFRAVAPGLGLAVAPPPGILHIRSTRTAVQLYCNACELRIEHMYIAGL